MKKKDRTYRLFLEDMILSMNRIAEYISGLSFTDFKHDYKTVDAVIRNFEVIRSFKDYAIRNQAEISVNPLDGNVFNAKQNIP